MDLKRKIKTGYERFLLDRIALPIIRRQGKDSNYVKHYRMEREFAFKGRTPDCMDEFMDRQVEDLLCLLSTQGDSGFSIGLKRTLFDKGASFGLHSPLTFADDEFMYVCDDMAQNRRLSSVFKGKDGRIYDIDAFSHNEVASFNIDTFETEDLDGITWSGCVWFYDDIEDDGWIFVSKGYIQDGNNHFTGDNHVVVPSITVVDNNCKPGTFIMNISKVSAIPQKFFKDYRLLPDGRDHKEELEFIGKWEGRLLSALKKL